MRHPMSLPNYKGCLMECYKSLPLYYTKMCFKNPELFGTQISLSPEQSTLTQVTTAQPIYHLVRQ
jgi:hypothetical protein